MPIVASRFQPPAFLSNGHIQTILPALLPRRLSIAFEHERLELEDGDFLDLDWARTGRDKLAILSHGLEGCSDDGYNRGMATALQAAGWDALAWNFRGCGKEMNRLPRLYHSGETGDLGAVIRLAAEIFTDRADWIQSRRELDSKVSWRSQPASGGDRCGSDLGADRSRCKRTGPRSTLEQSNLSAALDQKPDR